LHVISSIAYGNATSVPPLQVSAPQPPLCRPRFSAVSNLLFQLRRFGFSNTGGSMKGVRGVWVIGLVISTAVVLLSASAAFAADQHIVEPSILSGTVAEQAARPDADRAVIRQALRRSDVQNVAHMLGADLDRLSTSIDTLSGSDLERAASAARQVNQQHFAGGSTVITSTTTIIIVLLVVILLIVALK
jgi:hypothetical protein